ncbi:MAG: hypothetical protein HYT94_01960, partial [Parcubacteria group bacterium]|nr:hypothetical protein [Parcubacteria group bacterium]
TATSPALTINGKAQSSPTVAEDPANTLTTKGYVDAQASGGKITYFYKNKVCNSGVASGGYYVLNYAAKVPSTASSVIVSAYASSGVDPSHLYIKESLPENTNDMIRVVELGVLSGAGDRNMVFLPTTAARNFYIYKTGSTSYCLEGYVE